MLDNTFEKFLHEFNYREGDLELRSTGKNLVRGLNGQIDTTFEIVRWSENIPNFCWTIAYWENGELVKLPGRATKTVSRKAFNHLIEMGNRLVRQDKWRGAH